MAEAISIDHLIFGIIPIHVFKLELFEHCHQNCAKAHG